MSVLVRETTTAESVATWAQVSDMLWVASTPQEFVGAVEWIGDRYVASDGFAIEVGFFGDLDTAKNEVLRAGRSPHGVVDNRSASRRDMPLTWTAAMLGGMAVVAAMVWVATGLGS